MNKKMMNDELKTFIGGTFSIRHSAFIIPNERGPFVSLESPQDDAGLGEDGLRLLGDGILLVVDDLADARVDDHLGAHEAGRERDVDRRALRRDAVVGGLRDGVLLGVRADALAEPGAARRVGGAARAAALVAVADAARRAVVAGRDDAAVLHDHGGDVAARAVAARLHAVRDVHEVGVPVGARGGGGRLRAAEARGEARGHHAAHTLQLPDVE